jgi:hypothetical protein
VREECAVYSQVEAHSAAVADTLGIKLAREAAGTPVGTQAFVAAHALNCVSCACGLMDALDGLQLPVRHSWLLFHGSLQLRVARLPRIGDWEAVCTAVTAAESRAFCSLRTLMQRPCSVRVTPFASTDDTAETTRQIWPPPHDGSGRTRSAPILRGHGLQGGGDRTGTLPIVPGTQGRRAPAAVGGDIDAADGLRNAEFRVADPARLDTIARAQGTMGQDTAAARVL